jgi:RimJ/RimL family protein N-acetyltransferase
MIETDRLIIRHSVRDDLDDIFEYVSQEEVMKYERESYPTKEDFSKILNIFVEQKLLYSVLLKDSPKVIGHIFQGKTNPPINNEYNLGYIFNPLFQNKGYCSEACLGVLQYGFDVLKCNRIKAACNPENIASWKVMEKIGLKKEAHFFKRFYISDDEYGNPIYTDEYVYALNILQWNDKK